jgi:hypothetical protein
MNVFITKLRKYLSQDADYQIDIENLHSKGFVLKWGRKGLQDELRSFL